MQRLEVSGAVRPIYGSLGVKRLIVNKNYFRKHHYSLCHCDGDSFCLLVSRSVRHNPRCGCLRCQ